MFFSTTDGLTLTASQAGTVTKIVFDGDGLAGFGAEGLYTYNLTGGLLISPTPSGNGEIVYNEDNTQMAIFRNDNSGTDFRPFLDQITSADATGRIKLHFSEELQPRTFEFDGSIADAVYNGSYFQYPSPTL